MPPYAREDAEAGLGVGAFGEVIKIGGLFSGGSHRSGGNGATAEEKKSTNGVHSKVEEKGKQEPTNHFREMPCSRRRSVAVQHQQAYPL